MLPSPGAESTWLVIRVSPRPLVVAYEAPIAVREVTPPDLR
jgi:hypothetical protein